MPLGPSGRAGRAAASPGGFLVRRDDEAGDQNSEGAALANLGVALREVRRRFDEAITTHRGAVAIFRQTGDQHNENIAISNLEQDQVMQRAETETDG